MEGAEGSEGEGDRDVSARDTEGSESDWSIWTDTGSDEDVDGDHDAAERYFKRMIFG